jgi:hypothetical protein
MPHRQNIEQQNELRIIWQLN